MVRVRSRIKPKTKARYRDRIRSVIKGFSRKVLVYQQPSKSACLNCFYDKMTATSTGKCKWTPTIALQKQQEWETSGYSSVRYKYFLKGRCPVCKGRGYIETLRKTWTDCLVTWNPSQRGGGNEMIYTPAGTEGSTIVQLKTHPKYFDLFKNADKAEVDGVECKISRPPILRGLGNQSVLIVIAFTTQKPALDSDEIIKDYT